MQKKLRITVDDRVYNVIVEDLTDDGGASPHPLPGATVSPFAPGPAPAVPAVPTAATSSGPAVAAQPGDEISPLAGVVESIEGGLGAAVAAGDKIAVIEAMKMKTPIYAHHTGRITRINIKPGDAVEAGQILMTIG